jgi:hypothetical protein
MTTPRGPFCARLASLSLFALAACTDPRTETTETVRLLTDPDGDGMMSSPECEPQLEPFCDTGEPPPEPSGCIVIPNPGGCAAVRWTETVTTYHDGGYCPPNAFCIDLTQTYTVCELCLDAEGNAIGEEICSEEGSVPPVSCSPIPSFTGSCWECTTPDGQIYTECVEDPITCYSDEECPEGTLCQLEPFECPPNADCAQVMVGSCVVPDTNIYCASDEECPSGMVCEGEEILPCDPTTELCPMMAFPIQAGICVVPTVYCTSDADCGPNQICEYYPAPCDATGVDCGPIAPDGVCVDVWTDPCAGYVEEGSCNADVANGCSWIASDILCIDGENCPTGFCAQSFPADPCAGYFDAGSCNADAANGCGWISYLDDPNGAVCEAIGCDGFCVQLYPPVGTCFSDADCDPGQLCEYQPLPPCDPTTGICPMYVPAEGICVTPEPTSCSSDAECAAGQVCQLETLECPPNADCAFITTGTCVEVQPVDPCLAHADEQSCWSDMANGCGWIAFGMPCEEGADCQSGVCQQFTIGCGDGVAGQP